MKIIAYLMIAAALASIVLELLAIPVFLRLRSRHRKLYRTLLLNPFKDVLWASDPHEFCSTADMELVRLIRRYRTIQQYVVLAFLALLALGAVLQLAGFRGTG